MEPPERGSARPITAHYSFIDLERMKGWVGLVGWPCSRRFTHRSGHPSAAGQAQDREIKVRRSQTRRSTTVPHKQIIGRAAHTQRDSPGNSTRRGQRTFPSEYYEDGHTSLFSYISCSRERKNRQNDMGIPHTAHTSAAQKPPMLSHCQFLGRIAAMAAYCYTWSSVVGLAVCALLPFVSRA